MSVDRPLSAQGAAGIASGADRRALVARTIALGCLAAVLSAYASHALALVAYSWEWSPDEGLHLDHGRRLVRAPASLYPTQVTPYPAVWGPLTAVVLAPIAAWSERPLSAARVLNLVWVAVAGSVIAGLVARRAGAVAGAAALALWLAPFDLSFWHLLVRPDTPMLAAWLLAAWQLMPSRLERGADRLGTARVLWGSVFLLAAALFKPTALLYAAPLLGSWFLIDLKSALRLSGAVGLGLLVAVGLLDLVTHGGFLFAWRLFGVHSFHPAQGVVMLELFASLTWPVLVLAGLAFADCWRRGGVPWRDGSVTLILGGLLIVPGLAKGGAYFNYLLPLQCGLIVAAGRWLGEAAGPGRGSPLTPLAGSVAAAVVALTLATTTVFPLPSARQEATGAFFYGFLRSAAAAEAAPIFALAPAYAYYVVGQPVEMEATSFMLFFMAGAPGVRGIVDRLASARYGIVIDGPWRLPDTPGFRWLLASYRTIGECRLGSFLGPLSYRLNVRKGSSLVFAPPPGVDCRALRDPVPSPAPG